MEGGEFELVSENEGLIFLIISGVLFCELKNQNEILSHGCLAGSCGACVIKIEKGSENLSLESAVEADTLDSLKKEPKYKDQKIRLSCRVKVLGNLEISTLT